MELISKLQLSVVFLLLVVMGCSSEANKATFDKNYVVSFGDNHVTRLDQGHLVQLLIDPTSGAGFESRLEYLSGFFHMRIKLPAKASDGIITTFYLTTGGDGPQHDELDFEFLGVNELQTNIFVNGVGNREQRIRFWFDPTAEFHSYKILWNPTTIIFFVDETPIRIFENFKHHHVPFPVGRPMRIETSIWNASWAGPVDWNNGPFKAEYEEFGILGCPANVGPERCGSPQFQWNELHKLNEKQMEAYRNVKKNFMFYDYCSDPKRPPANPRECVNL